jgi:hypothetical protein
VSQRNGLHAQVVDHIAGRYCLIVLTVPAPRHSVRLCSLCLDITGPSGCSSLRLSTTPRPQATNSFRPSPPSSTHFIYAILERQRDFCDTGKCSEAIATSTSSPVRTDPRSTRTAVLAHRHHSTHPAPLGKLHRTRTRAHNHAKYPTPPSHEAGHRHLAPQSQGHGFLVSRHEGVVRSTSGSDPIGLAGHDDCFEAAAGEDVD